MTDWYGIKNRPGTLKQHGKLASTINSTATALNVRSEDTANFPPAPFLCTIGDEEQGYEIVKVTAVAGTEFTIERGFGDSTAKPFIGTTPVRINPLAEHIEQIQEAVDTHTHTLADVTDSGDLAALDNLSTFDTDDLSEGAGNLYHTDTRAVNAIKADADWNAGNWDTAYGWGDHAAAGYADEFDKIVHVAHGSDNTVARPSVASGSIVAWRGTVEPDNWVDGDWFIDVS